MSNTRRRAPKSTMTALFAALLAAGLVLGACGSSASETATPETSTSENSAPDNATESTSSFPQFTASTVSGGQLDFGSLEGQDTVIWFWAPW